MELMSDIKNLINNMAKNPYIEHEDVTKCGQCWKEKIKSEVANEFLKAGKLTSDNLVEMFAEIDRRWKQTELYQKVQVLLKTGKSIEQVQEDLAKEGIEI
jgi:superfamily II helicase